jgi:hypothetical protein
MLKPKPPVAELNDPRRTFETAISQLQSARRGAAQRPIVARAATQADPQAEKRVLNDAAKALAQLWKLSPALIR